MEFNAYFFVFFSLLFMPRYTSCGITAPCTQTPYPQPQLCHHFSIHHKKWFPFHDPAVNRKLLQSRPKVDVEVAQDGSGDYKSISEALAAVSDLRRKTTGRIIIHVKAGVYKEYIEIKTTMYNITFIGDGSDKTIVTGNRNKDDGWDTFRTATFGVVGDGFMAQDMTFENTAGPEKHQAVAMRCGANQSVFYRCSFKGYQDTLYVNDQSQFYRDCDIYGTTDFIFGNAIVVFQNCNIYVRRPMKDQVNVVTAQSRERPDQSSGIVIHNCRVTAAEDLRPVQRSFRTYLGRPWQVYSRTVILKSTLEELVDPAGWMMWNGSVGLSTLYYGEYMNSGGGADTSRRVKWPGYHVITSAADAENFTVRNFISGDSWISRVGVPFKSGL